MAIVLSIILITFHLQTSLALISCTSGECVIDCESDNCDIVICTNYASSCIVNCSDGKCKDSQFYLAARNYNTVYCTGEAACNELNIQCGSPDQPPIGYSEYDFIARYDSKLKCNFVSKPHPFIGTNPTPKPTAKLHNPLSANPKTPSPTASPILSTDIQNGQLNITTKHNGSIVGTEILIVLSAVGLCCVIFTLCFCICMSVDYHQKLALLRKQHELHEQHVADNISQIPDENIINMAIADAKSSSIITSNIKSTNIINSINTKCDYSNEAHTPTKLSINGNNSNAASSKSNCNASVSNAASTKLSINIGNNSNAASTKVASSKQSADNSTDIPSFSLSPIESQKSGYIVTIPITEHEMKSSRVRDSEVEFRACHKHKQTESDPNLDTKLSISITSPVIINGLHTRDMGSDSISNNINMDNNSNTVIRKHTDDTDLTINTIEQSIPS
eukprot:92675_1